MRLLVYFDLPVSTKLERKQAQDFRKNLLSEGFIMMQFSCYSRFCRNDAESSKYFNRVKKLSNKLSGGEVRILKITNKQYENMLILVKEPKLSEIKLSKNPLVIF
ncbi:CRISPR-associated endonuclease Cas2 [Streptobacillus moniliformis]|uniref:CRISPR-associated endoribonuclease Cas2 n=2 Tax=Streptobacillus moniliformis TaxID=34105 RepID=D1AUW4_STRM9|nr:CRISPR-associated endonuclease Cas2 [Streptobacillus moniliformis]ACZ01524.1 CRISPR-associated protein Cas2 [Streptobacillus moniliformis DSM 12112]QXW66204.1 CRISPR-associated endonuclease Cas2 [Streptobacillus moniliformis]SQA13311.1 CRISPR-associated endoribonuclease Cas2 [Streptobacillus moniliformis]